MVFTWVSVKNEYIVFYNNKLLYLLDDDYAYIVRHCSYTVQLKGHFAEYVCR